MSNLASLDLGARGGEARVRTLLEDLVEEYRRSSRLGLAVWYGKSQGPTEHYQLLMLVSDLPPNPRIIRHRQPLYWKTGSTVAPFVDIDLYNLDDFAHELARGNPAFDGYKENSEVLFFDRRLLQSQHARVIDFFNILTAPPGLIRCWYIDSDTYNKYQRKEITLRSQMAGRPHLGIVKTEESSDFMFAKGVPHLEFSQRWLPLSFAAVKNYAWYSDWQSHPDRPTFLAMEGESFYQILRFEVKTAPDYASKFQLLEKLPDDRYPEVYLRAVLPAEHAAA